MVMEQHYNIPLREENGQFVGACPLCGGDSEETSRFKITPDIGTNGGAKCHNGNCIAKGNVIQLVANIEEISMPKAAQTIAKWFEIKGCELRNQRDRKTKKKANGNGAGTANQRVCVREDPSGSVHDGTVDENREPCGSADESREPDEHADVTAASEADYVGAGEDEPALEDETELRHNPPLSWPGLKNLNSKDECLSELGLFLPELAEEFESGLYTGSGFLQGRYAVPIHNMRGELLAYCGYALTEDAERLKFPPRDKYDPTIDLFNLHRAIQSQTYKEEGALVIVEDILELINVHSTKNDNVVATMQGVPTEQQILRLRSLDAPRKAFSVFWNKPSRELANALAKLAEFAWVRVRYPE